jgi:hypothetical protein
MASTAVVPQSTDRRQRQLQKELILVFLVRYIKEQPYGSDKKGQVPTPCQFQHPTPIPAEMGVNPGLGAMWLSRKARSALGRASWEKAQARNWVF